MKNITSPFFLLLILVITCNSARAQSQAAISKIDSIRNRMQQLVRENNLTAIADFYMDDAFVRGSDAKLNTKAEILQYWSRIKGRGHDWYWETTCISGSDSLLFQTGISHLALRYGNTIKTFKAIFFVAWQLQNDGSYKISADIYR